ncbi:MAG TPA: hypothetical protein PKD64_02510 [Pirellulaceae bacterium]|nr:hypothetical protein [Pirellulaceae bacterium]HMO91041.1 hypothetical protein [Pirellulaceae bacterium]HMP68156.1 hypothetical protein [Pirellulaceae bacterium]
MYRIISGSLPFLVSVCLCASAYGQFGYYGGSGYSGWGGGYQGDPYSDANPCLGYCLEHDCLTQRGRGGYGCGQGNTGYRIRYVKILVPASSLAATPTSRTQQLNDVYQQYRNGGIHSGATETPPTSDKPSQPQSYRYQF